MEIKLIISANTETYDTIVVTLRLWCGWRLRGACGDRGNPWPCEPGVTRAGGVIVDLWILVLLERITTLALPNYL